MSFEQQGSGGSRSGNPQFDRLGRYEIVGLLGQGSFGVVYQGRDPLAKKDVAIKVCTLEDADLRRRFFREAEISRRLEHENIVTVHDFAEQDGTPYLVQEFLKGEDLREVIRRRDPWSVAQRLDILLQIARGLAYAHTCEVIHRDIKPSNVRILPASRAKIMDFGIAKLANDESRLTQKGVTMGTAAYLPPEQVRGGEVTRRADIFSFGVLAYELLCHQRPFRGKTISALVYQILYKAPDPLSTLWPTCPPSLSDLISRCLEKDPDKRCPDMETVVSGLLDVRQAIDRNAFPAMVPPISPAPAGGAEDEPSTSGSILSQSLIARTARDVTKELDAQVVAAARASRETQPVVSRSTRPMPPIPVTQKIDAVDLAEAATVVKGPPAVAEPGGGDMTMDTAVTRRVAPDELAGMAGDDALASKAEEISSLVAAGNLEAAMSRLATTIESQKGAADPALTTPAVPPPPASGSAAVPPPPRPAAGRLTPPPPATPGPKTKGGKKKATGPAPAKGGGLSKLYIGLGALGALLLVAVLGFWLGRPDAPEPAPTVIETPDTPEPTTPVSATDSGLMLVATPWARVMEVTDEAGYAQPLPENATTPLYLAVKPGTYRVTFSFEAVSFEAAVEPDAEPTGEADGTTDEGEADLPSGVRVCTVEVLAGGVGRCAERWSEVTAQDLLKESGWWK